MLTEKQIKDKIVELQHEKIKIVAAIREAEEYNLEADKLYIALAEQNGRIGAYEDVLEGVCCYSGISNLICPHCSGRLVKEKRI